MAPVFTTPEGVDHVELYIRHLGEAAYLLGINALRAAEAAAVRVEDCDRARGNLDRHGAHFLTACVAGV